MIKKAVVIDDDNFIRTFVSALLRQKGFEVFGARNAFEGIKVLKEEKPDLIVTDIHMPEMSGLELVEKIKKAGVSVKIIIMSGDFMKDGINHRAEAQKLGVDVVMRKPITESSFNLSLRSLFKED